MYILFHWHTNLRSAKHEFTLKVERDCKIIYAIFSSVLVMFKEISAINCKTAEWESANEPYILCTISGFKTAFNTKNFQKKLNVLCPFGVAFLVARLDNEAHMLMRQ